MKLKKYLSDKNISVETFAKMIGVSVKSVVRWSDGEVQPRGEAAEMIRRATKGAVTHKDFVK